MPSTLFRITPKISAAALVAAMSLGLSACGPLPKNTSLESVRQPVVERVNYVLDVTSDHSGLSYSEKARLRGWLEAMNLRYGDRIYIDDPASSGRVRGDVEDLVGKYGLLVSEDAPVTPEYIASGNARVIVTRFKAHVPGCPDWSVRSDANPKNGLSPNYGCATNSNLASMVANPEHLLRGDTANGNTSVMTSDKAIEAYRKATPTGGGGSTVSANATGGGN